jgi:hypothetical protein
MIGIKDSLRISRHAIETLISGQSFETRKVVWFGACEMSVGLSQKPPFLRLGLNGKFRQSKGKNFPYGEVHFPSQQTKKYLADVRY